MPMPMRKKSISKGLAKQFALHRDFAVVLQNGESHLFNAGAAGITQSRIQFMVVDLLILHHALIEFSIVDEDFGPALNKSLKPFAFISGQSNQII